MTGLRDSVVLDLLNALHDGIAGTSPAQVSFGEPEGFTSGDFLAIGVTDPGAGRPTQSANSQTDWAALSMGSGYDETGEIACSAWSVNGSDDMQEVVAKAYARLSEVLAYIRANYTDTNLLGVQGLWELRLAGHELQTFRTDGGCIAYLLFRLAFQATI